MNGYIFDLDGTIYIDNEIIPGVAEAIKGLKERGDKVIFLTNKSIASREDYVKKLRMLNIEVDLDEVINSNYITARYLKSVMKAEDSVYVIGEAPLFEELRGENIKIVETSVNASYVVIGWDREFTYDKLNQAYQAWKNGAEIIATNPDRTCPVVDGDIPDCGAMIGALEGATGEPIKLITGKPSSLMANYVLNDVLQMEASNCFMIGDRLETDIKMGNSAGMKSVLVMTGITTPKMLENAVHKPKYILESVRDILSLQIEVP